MSIGKTLFTARKQNITLGSALDWCKDYFPDETLPALVDSPIIHCFINVDRAGKATDYKGNPFSLVRVHEMRLFCPQWEMRWVHVGGDGTAVLIWDSESKLSQTPKGVTGNDILDILPNEYLLWGQDMTPDEEKKGWTLLAEARIGPLWVPNEVASKAGDHVVLQSKEYKARFAHGNVAVLAERLTGLSHYVEANVS